MERNDPDIDLIPFRECPKMPQLARHRVVDFSPDNCFIKDMALFRSPVEDVLLALES